MGSYSSAQPQYKVLLKQWKLKQYESKFRKYGWDDPIDWKEMSDEYLANTIGVSHGHVVKFKRLYDQ